METAEIRRRFLDHFEKNGHTVVPSASLISPDPSLLFTVAGMVPFIPYLTGQQTPPWQRATSVQKCIRTQDIEEVGKTTRHGTFFQMNGNFSFGDYFKEGAIAHAWELVTGSVSDGGFGFDPGSVWVTVFHDDDEAAALWKKVAGLPDERIQRRGLLDNYWHTGQPGPGGPCSEIYIDRGPQYGPDGGPIVDEDRFLEIWNLVFMQEQITDVKAKDDFVVVGELPSKNIDTGMGLERVAYLLQGVENLYEIDQVFPTLQKAAELAGTRYGADHGDDVRLRVVADHIRSSLMLIGDGVTPSNEGRGYVLRRLLRRSVRAMRLLGVQDRTLPELLPVSKDCMKAAYPDLESDFARISSVAYGEEDAFRRTLQTGTQIFDLAADEVKSAGAQKVLPGDTAFKLHDTYGFPIDLTLEMAAEQGLSVDEAGFRRLMTEQRERAKADAKAKKTGHQDTGAYRELREAGPTPFTGYEELETDSRVRGLLLDGVSVPGASEGETVEVVLDRTPFYAESGGQDSDAGVITGDGFELEVLDVQRPVKGLVVHKVRVLKGEVISGQEVAAKVDREWRIGACQAHSGTHIVHAALRQVLGPQALQSGSYNKPGYLRLDFAWGQALGAATRSEVEEVANLAIRRDHPVSATYMPLERARELGALALFGETYDEEVRVVEMAGSWSRELCGGTHVGHSSQVGLVTLTGESSVGAGSRRVEAFVGIEGFRYLATERALVSRLADLLKVQPDQLPERIERLVAQVRDAEKELSKVRASALGARAGELAASARDVYGVAFVGYEAPAGTAADDLRSLALDVRGRLGNEKPAVVAASGAGDTGRPSVVIAVNEPGREWGVKAGALVRVAAQTLGGGGGGKDDVAQGGGTDASKIGDALTAVEHAIGETVTRGS